MAGRWGITARPADPPPPSRSAAAADPQSSFRRDRAGSLLERRGEIDAALLHAQQRPRSRNRSREPSRPLPLQRGNADRTPAEIGRTRRGSGHRRSRKLSKKRWMPSTGRCGRTERRSTRASATRAIGQIASIPKNAPAPACCKHSSEHRVPTPGSPRRCATHFYSRVFAIEVVRRTFSAETDIDSAQEPALRPAHARTSPSPIFTEAPLSLARARPRRRKS